jgi:hypothetical protein
LHNTTGAAQNALVVNTPPVTLPFASSNTTTSSRPGFFIPADTADIRTPRTGCNKPNSPLPTAIVVFPLLPFTAH